VVQENARSATGGRAEVVEPLGEHVDALEVLHDDALDPQVGTPYLLDELGVVPSLDEDATRQRDPCGRR
jgi:hypothetical protein